MSAMNRSQNRCFKQIQLKEGGRVEGSERSLKVEGERESYCDLCVKRTRERERDIDSASADYEKERETHVLFLYIV